MPTARVGAGEPCFFCCNSFGTVRGRGCVGSSGADALAPIDSVWSEFMLQKVVALSPSFVETVDDRVLLINFPAC